MPLEPFKRKAEEIIQDLNSSETHISSLCDRLIKILSNFFEVSQISVKYRLEEVGLSNRISDFDDYEAVFADIHKFDDYVSLTPVEAYELLEANIDLQKWVKSGKYIFVEGYFVKPNSKYIRQIRKP